MIRKAWFWYVSSLLLALPATAASILERRLEVRIASDGTVREHELLRVRLESAADIETWTEYPIYLDDHRQLESVDAYSTHATGKRVEVRRRDRDRLELPSNGILHSSQKFELLSFRGLAVGSELHIDTHVRVEPYFPSGVELVRLGEPTERLYMEIAFEGPSEQLRWSLDGADRQGLTVTEEPGRLLIRGEDLDASTDDLLRYAWGKSAGWDAVERWYQELTAGSDRVSDAVRAQARELIAGAESPRQKLEALVTFVRRQVRYVAVEVGIGGFKPSPSEEVLARRWGDCKDKSVLLIDLLDEAGIAAYPALIRGSYTEDIDPTFPSPNQFNHLIVAIDAAAVDGQPEDPISKDLLFVDPTQTRGSASWLAPWVQAQHALVIGDRTAGLVRTPVRPALERQQLELDLELDENGDATGELQLLLVGRLASALEQAIEEQPPQQADEPLRNVLDLLLPGHHLQKAGWRRVEQAAPAIEVQAEVRFDRLVEGADRGRPSLRLPGRAHLPSPRDLDGLDAPLSLSAGIYEARWTLRLPEGWCRPAPDSDQIDHPIALSRQAWSHDSDGRWVIERQTEIRQRWLEPEASGSLREAALHEHRNLKRRIRLHCKSPAANSGQSR